MMGVALFPLMGYQRVVSDPAGLWLERIAVLAIGVIASFSLLYVLTRIEISGVKYFGRQRGWRVTHAVAMTVCAHASVGWLLGAVGIAAVSLRWTVHWAPETPILRRLGGTLEYWQWLPAMAGAFLIGMLVFESLVYVGIRRCRYANGPRA